MAEIWKDVSGYEGVYQISDLGNVRSLDRHVPMSDGRTYRCKGRLLKPAWNGRYFHVIFSQNGGETLHLIHRLVLRAFVGEAPEGMECRHLDGNSKNNHLTNLQWATHTQNINDQYTHGTMKGTAPKIPDEAVLELRRLRREEALHPHTLDQYAKKYNSSPGYIRSVAAGRCRKRLKINNWQ